MVSKYKNKPSGKFASNLERFCFDYIKQKGVDFEFQKTYILQDAHKRNDKHIEICNKFVETNSLTYSKGKKSGKPKKRLISSNLLPIKMIVDFFIEGLDFDVIIDTKGMKTPDWIIKAKMLQAQLDEKGKPTLLFIPSSQMEVKTILNEIIKIQKRER
jgi:hypothetical protein